MRPTERTLDFLRKRGYLAGVVERWMKWGKPGEGEEEGRGGNRVDLWGFADVLAVRRGEPALAVQCFGATGWSKHVAKILETEPVAEHVRIWLSGGHRLQFFAWRNVKLKRGSKATRWRPRVGEVVVNKHTGELQVLEQEAEVVHGS